MRLDLGLAWVATAQTECLPSRTHTQRMAAAPQCRQSTSALFTRLFTTPVVSYDIVHALPHMTQLLTADFPMLQAVSASPTPEALT